MYKKRKSKRNENNLRLGRKKQKSIEEVERKGKKQSHKSKPTLKRTDPEESRTKF